MKKNKTYINKLNKTELRLGSIFINKNSEPNNLSKTNISSFDNSDDIDNILFDVSNDPIVQRVLKQNLSNDKPA